MSKISKKNKEPKPVKVADLKKANPSLLIPIFAAAVIAEAFLLFERYFVTGASGETAVTVAQVLFCIGLLMILAGSALLFIKKWEKAKCGWLIASGALLSLCCAAGIWLTDYMLSVMIFLPIVACYVLLAMYISRDYFYELLVLGLALISLTLYYRLNHLDGVSVGISNAITYSVWCSMLVMAVLTQMVSMAQKDDGAFHLGKKINFRLLPRGTNYTEFYIVVVSTVLIILLGLFKTDWLLYAVLVIAAMLVALIVYRRFFKK